MIARQRFEAYLQSLDDVGTTRGERRLNSRYRSRYRNTSRKRHIAVNYLTINS
jgi:hypothetical protein